MIVGLDTASNRLHWVASEPIDDELPVTCGWKTSRDKSQDVRRLELFDYACEFFGRLRERDPLGDVFVFCEAPIVVQRRPGTSVTLGIVAGAIWAAHVRAELTWFWVSISSWKTGVLGKGYGMASKETVRERVRQDRRFAPWLAHRATFDRQPDLYDAWCLCEYGKKQLA